MSDDFEEMRRKGKEAYMRLREDYSVAELDKITDDIKDLITAYVQTAEDPRQFPEMVGSHEEALRAFTMHAQEEYQKMKGSFEPEQHFVNGLLSGLAIGVFLVRIREERDA